MNNNKSERLLNLLILLLVSRSFVTKDRIRDVIDDYRRGSDEAFEKMFERDKDELRSLGIPIEVGHLDAFFEDEVGYRIKRDAFELPQVELEPDEAAVVGLAARVWQHAGLADATSQALLKLQGGGPPGRPRGARRRAATARGRRAGVRRRVGRDPVPHAGRVRLPAPRARRADPPARAAVGRRQRARSVVRRGSRLRPRGAPAVPALADRRRRRHGRPARQLRRTRRHGRARADPLAGARATGRTGDDPGAQGCGPGPAPPRGLDRRRGGGVGRAGAGVRRPRHRGGRGAGRARRGGRGGTARAARPRRRPALCRRRERRAP